MAASAAHQLEVASGAGEEAYAHPFPQGLVHAVDVT